MKYGLIGEKLGHSFSKEIHEMLGYYKYEIHEVAKRCNITKKAIQYYVEKAIDKGMKDTDADRILCLVMNPQNGEIYAMANYPSFDLNEPFKINDEELEADEENTDNMIEWTFQFLTAKGNMHINSPLHNLTSLYIYYSTTKIACQRNKKRKS